MRLFLASLLLLGSIASASAQYYGPPPRSTMGASYQYQGQYQYRSGGPQQRPQLDPADQAALERIAGKMLGPVPADARDYVARALPPGQPARGCRPIKQNGDFTRWQCPRGTIQRLGL